MITYQFPAVTDSQFNPKTTTPEEKKVVLFPDDYNDEVEIEDACHKNPSEGLSIYPSLIGDRKENAMGPTSCCI